MKNKSEWHYWYNLTKMKKSASQRIKNMKIKKFFQRDCFKEVYKLKKNKNIFFCKILEHLHWIFLEKNFQTIYSLRH